MPIIVGEVGYAQAFFPDFHNFQTYFHQMTLKSRIGWKLFLELPQRAG